MVELLISLGCPPNHVDSYGQTAIFYGAREGHVEVCRRLVAHGANPDAIDNNG